MCKLAGVFLLSSCSAVWRWRPPPAQRVGPDDPLYLSPAGGSSRERSAGPAPAGSSCSTAPAIAGLCSSTTATRPSSRPSSWRLRPGATIPPIAPNSPSPSGLNDRPEAILTWYYPGLRSGRPIPTAVPRRSCASGNDWRRGAASRRQRPAVRTPDRVKNFPMATAFDQFFDSLPRPRPEERCPAPNRRGRPPRFLPPHPSFILTGFPCGLWRRRRRSRV